MLIKDGWAVVFDFDGTLLARKYVALAYLVAHRSFGERPDIVERLFTMHDLYVEKLARGEMTAEDERDWLVQTNEAYVDGGLTKLKIANALKDVQVRPGVRRCLEWLSRQGVPVAIVSFGFKPLIRYCLKRNGIAHLVDSVVAQEFRFDSSGNCLGWISGTGVSPHEKGLRSVAFAAAHGISPDRILAVGDSDGDRFLGHHQENRLGLVESQGDVEKIAPFMGEVIISRDFKPVTAWLSRKLVP